ncbi:hypothetical protein GJ496_007774 [Pomphorhynchus laevis]|nr:hypothetical protein GJ496_007774 [Pomphorhynchus laevis]
MSISRLTAAPTGGCETPRHAGHIHLGNSSACDLVNPTQERGYHAPQLSQCTQRLRLLMRLYFGHRLLSSISPSLVSEFCDTGYMVIVVSFRSLSS